MKAHAMGNVAATVRTTSSSLVNTQPHEFLLENVSAVGLNDFQTYLAIKNPMAMRHCEIMMVTVATFAARAAPCASPAPRLLPTRVVTPICTPSGIMKINCIVFRITCRIRFNVRSDHLN